MAAQHQMPLQPCCCKRLICAVHLALQILFLLSACDMRKRNWQNTHLALLGYACRVGV
jgi:hypothetical protein